MSSLTLHAYPVNSNQFTIGVLLAIASSLFIGTSFILKKKGLIKLTVYHGVVRAGIMIKIIIDLFSILLI